MDKYIDKANVQEIAYQNNLGHVYFEFRTSLNSGRTMGVGYIMQNNKKILFCKDSSPAPHNMFFLCNEFSKFTD